MEDVRIHNFHSPVFSSPEVRAQMSLNFDPPPCCPTLPTEIFIYIIPEIETELINNHHLIVHISLIQLFLYT